MLLDAIKQHEIYILLRKLYYFGANLVSYFTFRINSSYDTPAKKVFFDISNNDYHRYNLIFAYWFVNNGYRVYYKIRFNLLANLWGYSKKLTQIRNVSFCFTTPKDVAFRFTNLKKRKGYIYINHDYFNKPQDYMAFPYPMHPIMYQKDMDKFFNTCLSNNKNIQICFAGNTNKKDYSDKIISQYFKVLNRVEVVNTTKQNLPNNYVSIPKSLDELKYGTQNNLYTNKLVLVEKDNFSLNTKNYIYFLSKSQFFMVAPGVKMPYCHNIIEAMRLGTIPLIEFPDLFDIPLRHKVNCIAYKGEEEFTKRLHEIKDGKYDDLLIEMRTNVLKYYADYLSPESFINVIENSLLNHSEIYLNAEDISVSLINSNRI